MESNETKAAVDMIGGYITSTNKQLQDKINEIDDNVKRAKTAANLAAIISGVFFMGAIGVFTYDKMHQVPASGETY